MELWALVKNNQIWLYVSLCFKNVLCKCLWIKAHQNSKRNPHQKASKIIWISSWLLQFINLWIQIIRNISAGVKLLYVKLLDTCSLVPLLCTYLSQCPFLFVENKLSINVTLKIIALYGNSNVHDKNSISLVQNFVTLTCGSFE